MFLNKKGYITLTVVMIATVLALLVFSTFVILNANRLSANNNIKSVKNYYLKQATIQRIFAKLESNISYKKATNYSDINKTLTISEINNNSENVLINDNVSSSKNISFKINNSTPLNIKVNCYQIDTEKSFNYNISLFSPDNKQIINETKSNSSSWKIDEIYDSENDNFLYSYGDYELNLSTNNCYIEITVNYNNIKERNINVIIDKKNYKVSIKQNFDLNKNIVEIID